MMRKTFAFLLLNLLGVAWLPAMRAQGPDDKGTAVNAVVRKNRAPVNKEVLHVRLPRPSAAKLANGLTILILEQHKLPTVAFALWVKTGALADPRDLPGLAKFTAEMLREGTRTRTSAQIAAEVDEIGASLGAGADFGASVSTVSASGLVENADKMLELMSDIVLNPTFPAEELEKYKLRQLASLEEARSDPDFLSREKFHAVLYGDFPAAVVSATPESVKRTTPEDLQKFHSQFYAPGNALLGIVGDVTREEILALVQKHFGPWPARPVSTPPLGPLPAPSAMKIYLIDRPGSVQTNIVAGNLSVRRADPDYIPLTVMNRILGGGPTGRLFLNLREEKGYTYGAYSFFTADIYPGPWVASTEVRNEVTGDSLRELFGEFKRIREVDVPEAELDDARRAIVARFALSLEQPTTLLNSWLTVNYYALPEDYWDLYPEEVAKVNQQVVRKMARRYVNLSHLQVVCVGDGKQIKDVLSQYGPVEVFDTEGKPVAAQARAASSSGR
jgi:predicted Zn-dependent peptidase